MTDIYKRPSDATALVAVEPCEFSEFYVEILVF